MKSSPQVRAAPERVNDIESEYERRAASPHSPHDVLLRRPRPPTALAPFFPTRCVTLPTEPTLLSSGGAYGRRALDGPFACTPAVAFVDTLGASFRIAVTPVDSHEFLRSRDASPTPIRPFWTSRPSRRRSSPTFCQLLPSAPTTPRTPATSASDTAACGLLRRCVRPAVARSIAPLPDNRSTQLAHSPRTNPRAATRAGRRDAAIHLMNAS
jgi:hypothetical protein